MYTKTYHVGRLSFKVEAQGLDWLSLTRLPVVRVTNEPGHSDHHDQMCGLYFKPAVADEAAEQGVTPEEFISMCNDNAGFDSKHFVVAEYTGREGSSENLTPDVALDGFLDWEIEYALQTLEQDDKLIAYLTDSMVDKQLLIG